MPFPDLTTQGLEGIILGFRVGLHLPRLRLPVFNWCLTSERKLPMLKNVSADSKEDH